MNKERKINFKKISVIIFIIFAIVLVTFIVNKPEQKEIQLTQLKANSHRQMMGYIIKTSDDKVIVIDGGTKK